MIDLPRKVSQVSRVSNSFLSGMYYLNNRDYQKHFLKSILYIYIYIYIYIYNIYIYIHIVYE